MNSKKIKSKWSHCIVVNCEAFYVLQALCYNICLNKTVHVDLSVCIPGGPAFMQLNTQLLLKDHQHLHFYISCCKRCAPVWNQHFLLVTHFFKEVGVDLHFALFVRKQYFLVKKKAEKVSKTFWSLMMLGFSFVKIRRFWVNHAAVAYYFVYWIPNNNKLFFTAFVFESFSLYPDPVVVKFWYWDQINKVRRCKEKLGSNDKLLNRLEEVCPNCV